MKDKILNVIMGISILALIGAGYREYLIHNGKLTSDLNANGYSITNLPAGFFPAETDPTVSSWAKEAAPPNETDPTVPEWAKGDAPPLPPDYAAVASNAAVAVKTETDPTVPAWAKSATQPLPPNYTTVSNRAMNALQSYTENDPTVPAWAKAASKPTYGTNDIDGLSTALNGKLDKTGGTITGDVDVVGRFVITTPEMQDQIEIRDLGGQPGIQVSSWGTYQFPGKAGAGRQTFAMLSDIPSGRDITNAATWAAGNAYEDAVAAANAYTDAAIGAAIAPANPTFSNAVLSVGLGIDTNTVAAINALVEAGEELPIGGAATVGGLLLALAAAVAALKRTKADASALRYDLAAETVIDTASQETVEGETVNYGEATLADRTANRVSITAALDELRVTFPPAVSGKLRDFGLRVEVGTGSAALTAPAIVPVAPTGETIKLENNAKQIPALADGAAAAKGVTLLYFSESAPGVFFAKGEQVGEVA